MLKICRITILSMSYWESLAPSSHQGSQWKIAANQVDELQNQYEIDSVNYLLI